MKIEEIRAEPNFESLKKRFLATNIYPLSDSHKQKISDSMKKTCNTEEYRAKRKEITASKRRWEDGRFMTNYEQKQVEGGKELYGCLYEDIQNYYNKITHCEICGAKLRKRHGEGKSQFDRIKCRDHSHETGLFRGILCPSCNRCLYLFDEHFDKTMKYLNRTPPCEPIRRSRSA